MLFRYLLTLSLVFSAHAVDKPLVLSDKTPTIAQQNSSSSFGDHYAVLNLDLIEALVSNVNESTDGKKFIDSTSTWINAVHKLKKPPLTIFTRIYFSNSQRPEIGPDTPFHKVADKIGNITESSPEGQIYSAFKTVQDDVVLPKTRYYAGAGNALEEILKAHKIDTVVLSGMRTSGVILATAMRLFDLDYNVFVISNNTLEHPDETSFTQEILLGDIFPKVPIEVITLRDALTKIRESSSSSHEL